MIISNPEPSSCIPTSPLERPRNSGEKLLGKCLHYFFFHLTYDFPQIWPPMQVQKRTCSQDKLDVASVQVDIMSPGGKILARALELQIKAGKSLLITGPNGSGKSSVIK